VHVNAIARFLQALADETRLRMLWLLFNHRELCVCDIMVALGITQSKASRHLATLRHAGLVSDRKAGAWSYYALRTQDQEPERALLAALRAHLGATEAAAPAIEALHAWLASKDRPSPCAPGAACCAVEAAPAGATR
jgi:ArsR family transcriptional regulator